MNPLPMKRVIIGDEATFSMNGKVSSQNVRMYASQGNRPEFNYDKSNSREKWNVWVGLCGNGSLIGPYFFDGSITLYFPVMPYGIILYEQSLKSHNFRTILN